MNKRPRKTNARLFGTGPVAALRREAGLTAPGKAGQELKTTRYVGPSVEGIDVQYIEIVSGEISDRKPSFIR
ncbi:hypothetical protein [Paenibacillus tepidiphilus]|uniref:hypothetical protein n=1 Tax=Paenibacillus tepidiphilus TaxID=2608683 RepID=UPI001239B0BD|nr:hypothetical protein [Paenibacillus tepidiphilus]